MSFTQVLNPERLIDMTPKSSPMRKIFETFSRDISLDSKADFNFIGSEILRDLDLGKRVRCKLNGEEVEIRRDANGFIRVEKINVNDPAERAG